ncbi:MAG: hypothetical protein Q8O20_09465 [Sulfuricurvum sp.]|uniref:hypothetical protein n=1 Tax=Sulfuricurvum sp. TaxID=2025608 RepID=UPI002735441D|nr:hypothetical protein [Sulfuricurvum sp.]MDP2851283.1 hypothetical protein [Sulfuricurvum sp.]
MDVDRLAAALESKLHVTASVADRLAYSIARAQAMKIVPLTMEKLASLSDAEMEVMDAYIFRYGSLVSNIQDAIFKSIGEIEREPILTMSNRDKTNLMERLGVLPSADEFSSIAIIRNRLMHDYPEEMQKHLDRMNFIINEAPRLLELFLGLIKYAEKFNIHVSITPFNHLTNLDKP